MTFEETIMQELTMEISQIGNDLRGEKEDNHRLRLENTAMRKVVDAARHVGNMNGDRLSGPMLALLAALRALDAGKEEP